MNNKKIIFQVTKIYMKKNWRRTMITFAGIVIMVVLMTSVFVGKDTVLRFMMDTVAADQGAWHAQIYDINSKQVEEIRSLTYVENVEVARSLGYSEFAQSGNPLNTPLLEIKGYSGDIFDWMNIHVTEGRLPENEHELIISERAIKEGSDIQIGDTIEAETFRRYIHAYGEKGSGSLMFMTNGGFKVEHGDTVEVPAHFPYFESNEEFEMIHEATGYKGTYTVVGIMEMPYYEMTGQGGYIAITATPTEIAAGERINAVVKVDVAKTMDLETDLNCIVNQDKSEEELNAMVEQGGQYCVSHTGEHIPIEPGRVKINDMLLTFVAKGTDGTFNLLLIFFQAFFIVLIIVASFVLIYNVFNISFRERSKYLGMLSSVGATRAQKRWSVYYEVFHLLLWALPVGILLGLLVVKGGMALLYPHFSTLISMIGEHAMVGKGCEVGYHVVVNPMNLVFITLFSILAVWVSAWLPALKIGRTGAVESIRGNAETKAKSHKTSLRLMRRGHAESMLAASSVRRNRYSTKGIIRSIAAFMTLTVVTAFGAQTLTNLVRQKVNESDFLTGSIYSEYDYLIIKGDQEQYEKCCKEIMESEEVSDYKEINYNLYGLEVIYDELNDEYKDYLRKIIGTYYPNGIPEEIEHSFFNPQEKNGFYPSVNRVIVSDADFEKIAANAGIRLGTNDEKAPTVLIYDTVIFTTDHYRFEYEDGSITPDYTSYQMKHPLNAAVGEQFSVIQRDYTSDELNCVPYSLTLGGYVSREDIESYFQLGEDNIWMILSESTENALFAANADSGRSLGEQAMFFKVNREDSEIVRRLANEKDEFDNSILFNEERVDYLSLQTAISKILDIVAVSFTCLIAIICILNLYNSVMGRRMARWKELAVLDSVGMTGRQRQKMLHLENLELLVKSILISGVISTVFMVILHTVVSNRFGRLLFHMPTVAILVVLVVSVIALTCFTEIMYRKKPDNVMEELRTEAL